MRRLVLIVPVILAVGVLPSLGKAQPPDEKLRAAVEKALPLIQKGAVGHREGRTCFACHNQGIAVLALTTAASRGFEIDQEELRRQLQFVADFLGRNRENYLQGKGQGGQVDTAGYALLTLEAGGWKPDDTTAAVAEYLLRYQSDADFWRTNSRRPPSEASAFTTNYVGLRGLKAFGGAEQKDRVVARVAKVREWLLKQPAVDTEDRAFRVWAYKTAEVPEADLRLAVEELLATQQEDGGWRQLDSGEPESATASDAYATGTALVALHQAGGLPTSHPAYQRGLGFLLDSQLDDGTWLVHSRSKPFQAYFETGFPHGKDQFISAAATSWAAMAIALACEIPN